MGRRKIEEPTREQKERVRKPRTRLFLSAEKLSKRGADVFVAVRYYDELHYYKSSPSGWPLEKGDLVKAKSFRHQGHDQPPHEEAGLTPDEEPQNLVIVPKTLAAASLAINLRSPPMLQASPVEERRAVPQPFPIRDSSVNDIGIFGLKLSYNGNP